MSRRNAAEKRPVLPDPQFNSRLASMIVARLMKHGKKSTAQRILSDAFTLINERTGADPLELFETAVRNATPLVEVRARRVGGATYQVPMEVRQERGTAMALRWLVNFSRAHGRPHPGPAHGPLDSASRHLFGPFVPKGVALAHVTRGGHASELF